MSVEPMLLAGAALAILWLLLGGAVLWSAANVPLLADLVRGRTGCETPAGPGAPDLDAPGPAAATDESAAAGGIEPRPGLPTLSVVVTARDEAERIERTIRSLVAQDYPGLRVVAVDDRSTDATSQTLARLAADLPGPTGAGASGRAGANAAAPLSVVRIDDLPQGWIGKCYACHAGAARTRSDWILFMDGDVELLTTDLLTRVLTLATRGRLDHVALIPDTRPMSPLQAGLMAVFAQMYLTATRAFEMRRDLQRGGGGVGAFNLVRRAAYERMGGHTLVRMDLADDFKLGRLLKESGARQRFFDGLGLVGCRWYEGVGKVMRGLEKNFFAGLDYSLLELVAFTVIVLGLTFGPAFIALRGGTFLASLSLFVQIGIILAIAAVQAPRLGRPAWLLALLQPISVLLLLSAAWNSAVRTLRRGGVSWRGTFYALADLRSGRVRPGAGRRVSGAFRGQVPPRP